jgi:hypothetical protein
VKKGRFYRHYAMIQKRIEKIYPSRAFFLLRLAIPLELITSSIPASSCAE